MEFSNFYTSNIVEVIEKESHNRKNLIFVLLAQTSLFSYPNYRDYIVDIETFDLEGNDETFDKQWFAKVFGILNIEKDLHILSYAQFSYLIDYINSSFFTDRVIILKDNLRRLYSIKREEFLEKNIEENIERRPEKIPIYQAEQIQIDNMYFYVTKMPNEEFFSIDIFDKYKELQNEDNGEYEIIDVSSDQYALDYFINKNIIDKTLNTKAYIKIYSKQPISPFLQKSIQSINYVLNVFGGGLFIQEEKAIKEDYKVSNVTQNLLVKYWGDNAVFRNLKVYQNPNTSNQITEISQGLIVETIISEYENARNEGKTRDLFLTAPTGAGKSLLFQLPAFHVSSKGDVVIVVSPLIALMKDQVNAMIKDRNFDKVAYLNSELSLIDRERVIESCQKGDIDILYMAPELLMSYDITHFIGQRKLGLLVIDEAHLITTWGRDFRVDYWFLGNHIRKIRKYHNLVFPMVAVTATAVYGGENDMVFDSIDSLVMHNPHIFIGQVKREDITFAINNYDHFNKEYEKRKLEQTIQFIKDINDVGLKTLVYVPYARHIDDIINKLTAENLDIVTGYHGKLTPEQKEFAFRQFKGGQQKIMISTKAFGMGVDISDIELIYHHAPSGLLPDYVQEIGRVARNPKIKGFAVLNYSQQDQCFTKALHGMSALKQYQIKEVLKKIHKAYIKNNKSRNLLLSVDDFGYIFDNSLDLDQKVLTALMMIEKDYLAKHRFNVIIARPKKLFVRVYAKISDIHLNSFRIKYSGIFKYICSLGNGSNIIEVDLDKLWYQSFNDKSFPMLKSDFYKGNLFKNEGIELVPQLKISFERTVSFENIYNYLQNLFSNLQQVFESFGGMYFEQNQFEEKLNMYLKDKVKSEKISKFVLSSYSGRLTQPGVIESDAFLQQKKEMDKYKYRVFNNKYLANFASLLKRLNVLFGNTQEVIVDRYVTNKESNTINYVRLGYFLEMLDFGTFEIKGGENPMVFIRINDPLKIERDSNNVKYKNSLLTKTLDRHYISNQIFDHFFLRSFTNEERWDFIEEFFLGSDIDRLLDTYKGEDANNINIIEFLKKNSIPLNTEPKNIDSKNNIHTFTPRKDAFYRDGDLLTINNGEVINTMKIIEWITNDPKLLYETILFYNLDIEHKSFIVLLSKLRNNDFDYYKKIMGLNIKIDFKGYDNIVKAIVPYKDVPLEFYKWWCKNADKIYMTYKEKIELFNKISMIAPKALKKEHKQILNN